MHSSLAQLRLARRGLTIVALLFVAMALPSTWASVDEAKVAQGLQRYSPIENPLVTPFVETAAQAAAEKIADRTTASRRGYRVLSTPALVLLLLALAGAVVGGAWSRTTRWTVGLQLVAGLTIAIVMVERLTADRPLVARALEILGVEAFHPTLWPYLVLASAALVIGAGIAGAAEWRSPERSGR